MAEAEIVSVEVAKGAGDLPPGFKVTELGLLPEAWSITRLANLFEIQQGQSLSPKRRLGRSPRPFLRTANVLWGRIDLSSLDRMDFSDAEAERLRLRPGDLLVCEGGDIGRAALWSGEVEGCCYQNHLHRLRPLKGDVDPEFYAYWMQAAWLQFGLYGGEGNKTTIPNLSRSRLANFFVPLLPLEEQRAIARVLRTVQRAKEATEKAIAATGELKKPLMRHLFTFGPVSILQTDKIAPKDTEIGSIPAHWDMMRLGKLIAEGPQNGIYKPLHFYGTGVEILRIDDFDNDGKFSSAPLERVQIESSEQRKFTLRQDDILINRVNSLSHIGKSALAEALHAGAVFESNMMRFRVDESRAVPDFVHRYLLHPSTRDALRGMATRAVAQSSINQGHVCSLQIPIPPISEQQQIVAFLSATDAKLRAEASRVQALDILFQALLRNLLNGTVRVLSGATATSNGARL